MNFFAAQDRAKRATVILVFLYLVSIVAVVVFTDVAIAGAIALYTGSRSIASQVSYSSLFDLLFPWIGIIVTLIVVIATLMKAAEIRGGGSIFGAMLGGRFIDEHPTDAAEARLKNVVEEMAIAAGVKAPSICVLDNEPCINAFAAGMNNRDPVIGVTSGCLTYLSRDELQAIVAHEFSHILNNDTTLNSRAYALLFGLLAISVVGSQLAAFSIASDDDRDGRVAGILIIIGFLMMLVGWIGGLAGRMVRAAIVRQREYLADAASVQYTRNADSVASALYKMGTHGSHLIHSTGEEAEHYLFGSGSCSSWGKFALTRTHPKTASRINAVRPGYQASGPDAIPVSKINDDDEDLAAEIYQSIEVLDPGDSSTDTDSKRTGLPQTMSGLGAPVAPIVAGAALSDSADPPAEAGAPIRETFSPPKPPDRVVKEIPAGLLDASSNSQSAAAVCFAIASIDIAPDKYAGALSSFADADMTNHVNTARPAIKALPLQYRMALLDILIPTLEMLLDDKQAALYGAIKALLTLTPQPDMIVMAVIWRLCRYLGCDPPAGPKASSWTQGAGHVSVLLASIIRAQHGSGILGHTAYDAAVHSFAALGPLPPMPPPEEVRSSNIQTALMVLSAASSATRDAVVSAVARFMDQEQIGEPLADFILRMICDAADRNIPENLERWV